MLAEPTDCSLLLRLHTVIEGVELHDLFTDAGENFSPGALLIYICLCVETSLTCR